jgi:hypothetical protein
MSYDTAACKATATATLPVLIQSTGARQTLDLLLLCAGCCWSMRAGGRVLQDKLVHVIQYFDAQRYGISFTSIMGSALHLFVEQSGFCDAHGMRFGCALRRDHCCC